MNACRIVCPVKEFLWGKVSQKLLVNEYLLKFEQFSG